MAFLMKGANFTISAQTSWRAWQPVWSLGLLGSWLLGGLGLIGSGLSDEKCLFDDINLVPASWSLSSTSRPWRQQKLWLRKITSEENYVKINRFLEKLSSRQNANLIRLYQQNIDTQLLNVVNMYRENLNYKGLKNCSGFQGFSFLFCMISADSKCRGS
jgi:hypothetical protein